MSPPRDIDQYCRMSFEVDLHCMYLRTSSISHTEVGSCLVLIQQILEGHGEHVSVRRMCSSCNKSHCYGFR